MQQRKLIYSNIINAWEKSIDNDYNRQRINSERSLQASFWSYLNQLIPNNQQLFIEPRVVIRNRKLYPDIVVCRNKLVTAIVELKYLPRTKPRYKKDIASLASIARNRNRISISNVRYRGIKTYESVYKLSSRILFVYACVHKNMDVDEYPNYAARYKSLKGCYLQLHAETHTDSKSKVFYYNS